MTLSKGITAAYAGSWHNMASVEKRINLYLQVGYIGGLGSYVDPDPGNSILPIGDSR